MAMEIKNVKDAVNFFEGMGQCIYRGEARQFQGLIPQIGRKKVIPGTRT
jgi:hypothetical protein